MSDIDLHVENNENERDYANSGSEEPKMLIDLNPSGKENHTTFLGKFITG